MKLDLILFVCLIKESSFVSESSLLLSCNMSSKVDPLKVKRGTIKIIMPEQHAQIMTVLDKQGHMVILVLLCLTDALSHSNSIYSKPPLALEMAASLLPRTLKTTRLPSCPYSSFSSIFSYFQRNKDARPCSSLITA